VNRFTIAGGEGFRRVMGNESGVHGNALPFQQHNSVENAMSRLREEIHADT
jgi:hypothetical protein